MHVNFFRKVNPLEKRKNKIRKKKKKPVKFVAQNACPEDLYTC